METARRLALSAEQNLLMKARSIVKCAARVPSFLEDEECVRSIKYGMDQVNACAHHIVAGSTVPSIH